MPLREFVPLAAMMISLVALSIDAMLPALPAIGAELAVTGGNDAQLVVSALLIGLGLGQLVYGPVSDSVGRKPAIYAGFLVYMSGTALCMLTSSFEVMLLGRVIQGVGAAGPRIVTVALVRDQYQGDAMARVMSFVMAVFIMVPAIAPSVGQAILLLGDWRSIFATFLAMAMVACLWFALRQPETLPVERRLPFSPRRIGSAVLAVLRTPAALGYTVATGCIFAPFVGYLSSAQQLFQEVYGIVDDFPLYFAGLALAIGSAALVNGRFVMRFGMHRIALVAAAVASTLAATLLVVLLLRDGALPLWSFMTAFALLFFCVGGLFGNLNAMAMEPLGHLAGVGASVVGALSTCIAVPLGAAIGQAFDGSVVPVVTGFAVFASLSLATMLATRRLRTV